MRPVSSLLLGALAVLLHALGCCASGQRQELGMVFNRHPQPLAAPLGDEVYFECNLNLAAEKFAWRHRPLGSENWGPLINAPNSGGKTSKHVVNFDDSSKAGDYRCIAFYGTSGLASDPARLSLATIEKFTDKSNVIIRVPAGNTVPITCPVPYSSPEPVVQFFKNDSPTRSVNITGSKTMVIENARVADSGEYDCTAENYITTQTYRSNFKTVLEIYEDSTTRVDPYFVKKPKPVYTILRGKNVTLECYAAGYPLPRVTWTKLGRALPIGSRYTSTGLSIVNVQSSDRGEYDCMWSTGTRNISSAIILKVVEVPRVVRPPKAATFSEGGELELSCSVTGDPPPSLEWLINGEPLLRSENIEIKGTTLFISPVEKRHAGFVQCVASNDYGSHSGYNLLRVNPKQHVGGGGSGGGGGKSRDHGPPNGGVHKHTRVGVGRRRSKEGHRKGTVLVPPDQPNVTRLSDVSVMVRWSVPDNKGLPIQFFKVQYRELGQKMNGKQSKWMTANMEIPNHVRSFEVTDLQPDHTYRFRIAAVYSNNDNELSPNSVRFHLNRVIGFDSNKMPIPLLTNTEALDQDRVLLVWQNPDRTADIDGFYVYHRASTSAGEYIKTTVEGKNSTNITISHLSPDTTYEFKVQSFSVDAASEFSKIIREKTLRAITEAPPVQQIIQDNNKPKNADNGRNGNMYAIIGGALGGATLLASLGALAIFYKRNRVKHSRESSQNEGKSMSNGRVMNGGINDSKINITSNPLAVLDTTEDTMQPKSGGQHTSMEMSSFLNGQNNNSNNPNGESTGSGAVEQTTHNNEPAGMNQGTMMPNEQTL